MKIKIIESYNDFTIKQYQEVLAHLNYEPADTEFKAVKILYGLSDAELSRLSTAQLEKMIHSIKVISNNIPKHKPSYIIANGKRYKPIYDLSQMPPSSIASLSIRYLPKNTKDMVEMTPYLVARMVQPMKRTIFCWKVMPHDQKHVEDYTEDLKWAKAGEVCRVFITCLVSVMQKEKNDIMQMEGSEPFISDLDMLINLLKNF